MKKLFIAFCLMAFLFSCGGNSEKEQSVEETQIMTTAEESELATELSNDIQDDKKDVKDATEETLQEVDSLLENF